MARVRGCGVVLILLGLIGIIAPLCGYQNKLISSTSNELGIPSIVFSGISIIAGFIFLVLANRDFSDLTISNKHIRLMQKHRVIICPVCEFEMWEGEAYCRSCGTPLQLDKAASIKGVTGDNAHNKSICPFCGKDVEMGTVICPYCFGNIN